MELGLAAVGHAGHWWNGEGEDFVAQAVTEEIPGVESNIGVSRWCRTKRSARLTSTGVRWNTLAIPVSF